MRLTEICKTILTHWYWTGWLNKCCWRGKPRWHGLVDSLRMWWNLYWQNLKTYVVQNQGAWQRHLPLGDPDHGCFRRSPQQWTLITQEQSKVWWLWSSLFNLMVKEASYTGLNPNNISTDRRMYANSQETHLKKSCCSADPWRNIS